MKTFIDLFAGCGGFRHGMELAGHKCVGFCEFDKYAVMSYTIMHLATREQLKYIESIPAPLKKDGNRNLKERQKEILKDEYRNGEWYANDIRAVEARNMPRADMWLFGAPCQDFSIAGARRGLNGDRSGLVREVFRLVGELLEEDRPQYLIYENVKGMLSSNNGWDFACVQTEMESLGYDVEYQLLNSKDFEVPQNRERVFTIGHLRGRGTGKVFPIGGTTSENSVAVIAKSDQFGHEQNGRIYSTDGISPCLNGIGNGGNHEPKIAIVGNVNPSGKGMNGNVFDPKGLSPTLTTNKGEGNKVAIPVLTPGRANKRQNGRRFKEDGEPMFTLTSQDRHGVAVYDLYNKKLRKDGICGTLTSNGNTSTTHCGSFGIMQEPKENNVLPNEVRMRKLTPRECFRLQAWEDIYFDRAQLVNSDSQLYKQAGNQVTVSVVYEIGKRLVD